MSLTREQIEELRRQHINRSHWMLREEINALCDLALSALPQEAGGEPQTLSEFVHASDDVRARIGEEVIDRAIDAQKKAVPQEAGGVHSVEDGFGAMWTCELGLSERDCCLQVVRPGKADCERCHSSGREFAGQTKAVPQDEPAGLHTSAPIVTGEVRTPAGTAPGSVTEEMLKAAVESYWAEAGTLDTIKAIYLAMRPLEQPQWVSVPVEPTAEMIQAMEDRQIEGATYIAETSIQYALWKEVYKAMLAAAPVRAGEEGK